MLATAGAQGVVSLWDVSTQRHLLSLPAHSEPITSIVFPPDDPVSEWDKEDNADPTGRSGRDDRGEGGGKRGEEEERRRRGFTAGARGAVAGGAGAGASDALGLKRMLTASHDQTVRVWDLVRLAEVDADVRM